MATVLAVIPHPDDESYSFGGLLALAASSGARCVVLALTSGDQGEDHGANEGGLHRRRERELEASCRALGAEPPQFARLPDGGLAGAVDEATARITEAIGELRPDVLLALGPDGVYGHPDHLAVWRAVRSAWQGVMPQPLLTWPVFPAGLFAPQYEQCVATGVIDPAAFNVEAIDGHDWQAAVDIRDVAVAKLDAIAAHRSQLPGGDPRAIFPPGIVDQLLDVERYAVEGEPGAERVRTLFESLAQGRITCG